MHPIFSRRGARALLWLAAGALGGAAGCGLDDLFGPPDDHDPAAARQPPREEGQKRARPARPRPAGRGRRPAAAAAPEGAPAPPPGPEIPPHGEPSAIEAVALLGQRATVVEWQVGLGLGLQHADALRGLAREGRRLADHPEVTGAARMPAPHGDLQTFTAVYTLAAWAAQEASALRDRTGLVFGPQRASGRQAWGWRLGDRPGRGRPLALEDGEAQLAAHIGALEEALAPLAAVAVDHPRVARIRDCYLPALRRLWAEVAAQLTGDPDSARLPFSEFVGGGAPGPQPVARGGLAAARRDYLRLLGLPEDDLHTTDAQLLSAYRRRALQIHPDKSSHPDAQEIFTQLGRAKAAYERLRPAPR